MSILLRDLSILVEELGKRVRRFVAVLYNGHHADDLIAAADSLKFVQLKGALLKRNVWCREDGQRRSKGEVPAHSVKEKRSGEK